MIKEEIQDIIAEAIGAEIKFQAPKSNFGNYCLTPGQIKKLSENADELVLKIKLALDESGLAEDVRCESGYINIYLSKKAYLFELEQISKDIDEYLKIEGVQDQTIVFDYSSPNIAKPFSVGHLRSTVIGQANYNIHKALGYKTVGINHIGDWGTQFGKLIVAIKKWGNTKEIEKNPIVELTCLYQKFHEEAGKDKTLEEDARTWFKKLEDGDSEAKDIWAKCIAWSYNEFEKIYKILGIEMDETKGESFYEDKFEAVVAELKEKNLLKESEGAEIVELEGMPPALIRKSDGATLYMTRDLAALKYRLEVYNPIKIIYHVGNDQSLHFRQLEAVAKKMGWLEKTQIIFAGHGMMRLPEGKMSTRAGKTVLLEDLIEEAQKRSLVIIEQKNPDLPNKESIAEKIGISAIKYADLSLNRKSDVVFSFERAISLLGNSGPYLEYTYARCIALIRRFHDTFGEARSESYLSDESTHLAAKIINIKSSLRRAAENSSPNILCELAYEIANGLNSLYEKKRVVTNQQEESRQNIFIIEVTETVLGRILDLLGISKLEEI